MKKIIMMTVFCLFIICLCQNIHAVTLDYEYTQASNMTLPLSTITLGVFNFTKVNETVNESLDINISTMDIDIVSQSPFNVTYEKDDFYNYSEITFNLIVTEFFSPGLYPVRLSLSHKDLVIYHTQYIEILEYYNWSINQTEYIVNINSSEKIVLQLELNNYGNTEIFTNATIMGSCLNYSEISNDRMLYPNIKNYYLFTTDIPREKSTTTENCSILFTNINNVSQQEIVNISINIVDNINPTIIKTKFNDVMATKSTIFEIEAKDNSKIESVSFEILYLNKTVWYVNDTQYSKVSNVSVGEYNMTEISNDIWSFEFEDTDTIGQYHVNYKIRDITGNNISGIEYFEVTYLDCIMYNTTLDLGFIELNYESEVEILDVDYDVEVSINITDIKVLESIKQTEDSTVSYIVGIKSFTNDNIYFDDDVKTVTIKGTGKIYLLFSSNVAGRVVGEIHVSSIEQHVPLQDMTFSVQVIDYKPPYTHYENNPFPGISHVCDLDNTGDLMTSVQVCTTTIRYPYFLSEENIPIVKNLKEIEQERAIWDKAVEDQKDTANSLRLMLYLLSAILVILSIYIFYEKRVKPYTFIIGG